MKKGYPTSLYTNSSSGKAIAHIKATPALDENLLARVFVVLLTVSLLKMDHYFCDVTY